ncbi:hypothetical protein MYP_4418 [Sporocytophaga myxococcoides]|uniref:Uncharacterized protein n=1 Tax=Sporocytophaga myxococcoides TaxID=153721 RepID=A0A098LM18_9BACT|nr:hypothetical protein MYP_4418 [Sporocytophaga myxococcoides]
MVIFGTEVKSVSKKMVSLEKDNFAEGSEVNFSSAFLQHNKKHKKHKKHKIQIKVFFILSG